jgi:methyl-accepting chemotaxis protein
MIKRPRFRSLRWRINATLITGIGVVAIGATLLISIFLVDQLQEGMEMKARALAALLGENLSAALDFDDKEAASETMAGLNEDKEFTYAAVYKMDGSELTRIGKVPSDCAQRAKDKKEIQVTSDSEMIHVIRPIYSQKKIVGHIAIGFSMKQIHSRSFKIRVVGILSCTVLIALLSLYFAYAMNRTVLRPIAQLITFVQEVGEGDLRKKESEVNLDEETLEIRLMREALSTTTESFRDNVHAIQLASNQFAALADDIIASSSKLSDAAKRQVDGVAETFTTSKRMEAAGQETANNAQDISKAAETSVEISGDGLSVVRDSVSQFHSVRDQVQTIVSAVDKMNAQLSRIDAIIQSVSDVAKQSQLLAVNASIEAAKAGDAGLRFAVVAKEIKQMAVQSREATDSVRQTLGNVKKGIQNIAEVSEDGRRRTGRGMESIETTGKVITRLAEVINNTAQAARRISTNTQKQVDGLKEMSSSMFQIDDLSKGNLGAVRQIEAYGEKLNSKAKEMEKLVSKFRIG